MQVIANAYKNRDTAYFYKGHYERTISDWTKDPHRCLYEGEMLRG